MYWCEERVNLLGSFGSTSSRNSANVPRQCCAWCSVANAVRSSMKECREPSFREFISRWAARDSDSVIFILLPDVRCAHGRASCLFLLLYRSQRLPLINVRCYSDRVSPNNVPQTGV